MGEIKLPFEVDVEMRLFNNKSFPLGVIKANRKDYNIWLCNKLINCLWSNKSGLDFIGEDLWSQEDNFIFLHGLWMEPNIFTMHGFDLIEFNKSMLKKGHYITGEYNEFYIPNRAVYHNFDFDHDYIIFGYNDEKKVFYSAAYNDKRIYSYCDINYSDYYNAVINTKAQKVGLNFRRVNVACDSKINLDIIKKQLKDYYKSENSNISFKGDLYGMNVWKRLSEYVVQCGDELDVRYSRGYMEHHFIMLKRMQVFQELGYIKNQKLVSDYERIYLKSKMVHNMSIKFNITKDKNILNRISKIILELFPIERELIHTFIDVIVTD